MASNLQSVVCCLGDPVAGNPTQFLMQRASTALGIDWTFLTSEVAPERLKDAMLGIRALQFSGMAVLAPHHKAAVQYVDELTEAARLSGRVRIAKRIGERWIGHDSLGEAIVELIERIDNTNKTTATNASSPISVLCASESITGDLLRLAAPHLADTIHTFDSTSMQATTSIDVVIVDETSKPPTQRFLANLKASSSLNVLFVQSNEPWENAIHKFRQKSIRIFRPFDLAVAKAKINFHFWTGYQADRSLLRESLDEYCQW
jgi:shikimate dehydrogenase